MIIDLGTHLRFSNVNLKAFFRLPLNDIPCTSETIDGIVFFTVEKTPHVLELIQDFHNDAPVPVKTFIQCLQKVKIDLYAKRGGTAR